MFAELRVTSTTTLTQSDANGPTVIICKAMESDCEWCLSQSCSFGGNDVQTGKRGKERVWLRETDKEGEILMAAQGWKSSQSKQHRLTQQQQQTTGPRAVWPRGSSTVWPSGSLRRCPLIFPRCLSKESTAGPASGRDGISDSALLGFLDRHGGTFWEKKHLQTW